jgi:hypothetical protein
MEQAKGWVFENRTDVWDDTDTYYELAMEKLAELIVGECIKTLADNSEFRACAIIVKHLGTEQ